MLWVGVKGRSAIIGADLLALTDLLSRHKEQISQRLQGLPAWVIEEHQQYLKSDEETGSLLTNFGESS